MNRPALFALTCLLPLLGACSGTAVTANEGQSAPQFGDAVRRNVAAQTINPDAPVSGEPITMDGQRAALAQDRYTKGKVIAPADVGSTSGSGGGSGGSGSGGGSSTTP
jgi:type IV pilus biogenesis protein CpaD/CtpE